MERPRPFPGKSIMCWKIIFSRKPSPINLKGYWFIEQHFDGPHLTVVPYMHLKWMPLAHLLQLNHESQRTLGSSFFLSTGNALMNLSRWFISGLQKGHNFRRNPLNWLRRSSFFYPKTPVIQSLMPLESQMLFFNPWLQQGAISGRRVIWCLKSSFGEQNCVCTISVCVCVSSPTPSSV